MFKFLKKIFHSWINMPDLWSVVFHCLTSHANEKKNTNQCPTQLSGDRGKHCLNRFAYINPCGVQSNMARLLKDSQREHNYTHCINSFHTDPVFSCQNVNVVCLSDFAQFCNFFQHFELKIKERSFRIIWSRSTAFLDALWMLRPTVCRGKLLTQSSFGVE